MELTPPPRKIRQQKKNKLKNLLSRKGVKTTFISLLTITFISGILGYLFIYRPGKVLYQELQETLTLVKEAKNSVKKQNLEAINKNIDQLDTQIDNLQLDLEAFRFTEKIPFLKTYYLDTQTILRAGDYGLLALEEITDGLTPFAETLGLTQESADMETQEKIAQLGRIMPQIVPNLENAEIYLHQTLTEIEKLHPEKYPKEIKGLKPRQTIQDLQKTIPNLQEQITDIRPFLEELPKLMGIYSPQNYLLLFQNDKELRPTGGFITAYAIVNMNYGYFSVLESDDIYNLDPEISLLPVPQAIIWHLQEQGFWMRDTNFSPDYYQSMQDFELYYQNTNAPEINGIIALDTQFLESFLSLTGPVELEGYTVNLDRYWNLPESCLEGDSFFTQENVVCRLELFAQREFSDRDERKDILGNLMNKLIDWALKAPAKEIPNLAELAINQLDEKHLLLYLHNQKAQQLAEKYNWAGRIKDSEQNYLHISQANLAGLKSDMYMQRRVSQEISKDENGKLICRLTIYFHNTGAYDGWLNSTAQNYVRVYVPYGSQLINSSGGNYSAPLVFTDLGKTVFANYLRTPPLTENSLYFEYELPSEQFLDEESHQLLIQKQPGTNTTDYTVSFNDTIQNIDLIQDTTITF